ncbi:hypothetical protein LAZ67_6001681 [Cordylochernes scorpioides]|uniref:Sulfotransferase domain-containing protein n=1 Tax=Cordylochernes scorpioides TaxID=51811 RepID=A0ABY6KL60_9ARAC|nr:hypothetical protein LAZ67_6001681 [Cordylochernes scorpioides]
MLPSYKEIDGIKVLDVFPTERVHSALQYKPNPDDIFVTSFPKSGTNFTWTLVYLIINKGQPCQSFDEFTRNSPFLEISGEEGLIDIKQPKIIKTHLPFSKIPKSKEAKYIYIARNPKDLVTSYYHHRKSMIQNLINFDQFLNRYLSHELNYGDHIKHILEWYDHRHEQNILMLTYEQVLSDKKKAILEIAKFLDQEVMLLENPDILEKVMKYSSINECRKVIQLQNIIKKMGNKSENIEEDDFQFVRKGIVGDWENHFSKEQSERLDKIAEERLAGQGVSDIEETIKSKSDAQFPGQDRTDFLSKKAARRHHLNITDSPVTKSRQDSGRQGTSKQVDHCLYRKMEQGREEDPKEPMESDPDSESGGSPTFPKKETTFGKTQEIAPSQEDVTPPPPVSDVLGRLTTTLHQLSAVTGHRERWNRYDGSYEAQSFFTNYDAQADRAQLQYSTSLKKPPDLLQAPLRVTNTRACVAFHHDCTGELTSRFVEHQPVVRLRLHFVNIRKVLASKVQLECWKKMEVAWGKFRRIRWMCENFLFEVFQQRLRRSSCVRASIVMDE